jgi:F0F1-type ATP synthase assembly protein I
MIDSRAFSRLARGLALGAQMAFFVVFGTLVGGWLDEKLGSTPVLLLVLSLGGLVLGLIRLVRGFNKFIDDPESSEPDP